MSVVKSTEFIIWFNSFLGIFNLSQESFASVKKETKIKFVKRGV